MRLKSGKEAYHQRAIIHRAHKDSRTTGSSHSEHVLEVRRSMIEVSGYVCLLPHKRNVLRLLSAEMQAFASDRRARSFMLQASPGAGKSYLITQLATSHDFELLQFNITSLLSRTDLLDCFDTIVTAQARDRGRAFLIFCDEIDANLIGHPVYDAFLRPLAEGLMYEPAKRSI
jgi:predicted AAA+ superfamily ATPase